MVQRFNGSFRGIPNAIGPNPVNAWDIVSLPSNSAPVRSSGSTIVDVLNLVPPMLQRWTLQQVTITAQLMILMQVGLGGGYGKFGQIMAGVTTGATQTSDAGEPPLPHVQLPSDMTAVDALWDPASDPLPPVGMSAGTLAGSSVPTQPLWKTITITPPTAIVIDQAEPVGVGIWMLPSLLGQNGNGVGYLTFFVGAANYTVIYDDGVTPPAPGHP